MLINPRKSFFKKTSDICKACDHKSCCSGYDSPILLPPEINQIMKTTEKDQSKFSKRVSHEGKFITVLKKKKKSTNCIFWNEKTKQCSIYNERPFDCQMFPFDIYYLNKDFYWVIYSCNDLVDWGWTEEYLQGLESNPMFDLTMKNTIEYKHYSYLGIDEAEDYQYTVLRKVKWNSTTSY